MIATIALIASLLLAAPVGAEPNYSDCVVLSNGQPTCPSRPFEDLEELWRACEVPFPPHANDEKGWKTYRTYEVYHLSLFREMCLSWYAMQQPKNHWILLSRGAPNF